MSFPCDKTSKKPAKQSIGTARNTKQGTYISVQNFYEDLISKAGGKIKHTGYVAKIYFKKHVIEEKQTRKCNRFGLFSDCSTRSHYKFRLP